MVREAWGELGEESPAPEQEAPCSQCMGGLEARTEQEVWVDYKAPGPTPQRPTSCRESPPLKVLKPSQTAEDQMFRGGSPSGRVHIKS